MEIRGKRFLVIGGAGLIGSHTVDELAKEDVAEIRVFDNFSRGKRENLRRALSDPRVNVFVPDGELLHPDVLRHAMRDVDGVFHFAALWLLHCEDFPRSAFEVNVGGTLNVLEAIVEQGVKRLVFSSSASVYGDAANVPMTEDHPLANTTFYGATKIAGEQLCRATYHRVKNTARAFDYVGLRYMNVYGTRQDYRGPHSAVAMKILDRIDSGLPPLIDGDGSQSFDFIDAVDCARANVLAMKAHTTDRFYNIGSGTRTSIRELAGMLLALKQCALEPEFRTASRPFVMNRIGSIELARHELGFEPQTSLEDGLRELVRWRECDQQITQVQTD